MFVGVKKSGEMMKTKKKKKRENFTRGLSFLSNSIIIDTTVYYIWWYS